ncbi:bifunctional DNA primase/polymerase [Streptomyces sp. SL13]|uniref:Bifunctional DNA primase/polymerase n=1 Tax=Streptantibioticus silvisoli TaxID=2705255 RepID=A0AA90KAB4_9ACTN|nr:bifunctional DNA primase/polymerase [Streptantibioticus silvisoli]MDI5971892.1 bifunctional DNA primase/polymerase [Streptantibioticus silvisoli]
MPHTLTTALHLAQTGIPVLPLRAGKVPFGNCPDCRENACGGRPNMKTPGPCACPRPCHGWAAATTDHAVITSRAWADAWYRAGAVAYHPGGADLTVVDLDSTEAITWAGRNLPGTWTITTMRGRHLIYRGAMASANHVRPGVDIKSRMAYARHLGPIPGFTPDLPYPARAVSDLPDAVRALTEREDTTAARAGVVSSLPAPAPWDRTVATGCRHTDGYVRTGVNRGLDMVRACHDSGAGSKAFGVASFLAAQHTACPGPCGLDRIAAELVAEAVRVGVPRAYAERAVARGFNDAGRRTA